jgi:hypothetical protein
LLAPELAISSQYTAQNHPVLRRGLHAKGGPSDPAGIDLNAVNAAMHKLRL